MDQPKSDLNPNTACPSCGSSSITPTESHQNGNTYACQNCGQTGTTEPPTQGGIKSW